MKKTVFTVAIFFIFSFNSFGQTNPIENLTWSAWYVFQHNYFILEWEEPAQPHDELIGYNVYRENELYRFQTENSLYNLEDDSNCEVEFLLFNEGQPFYAHVTAVYIRDIESDYTEDVLVDGAVLNINENNEQKAILYPNPTRGILNIENKELLNIQVFDLTGRLIKQYNPSTQIDLSNIQRGTYLIKLISEKGISVKKIILK